MRAETVRSLLPQTVPCSRWKLFLPFFLFLLFVVCRLCTSKIFLAMWVLVDVFGDGRIDLPKQNMFWEIQKWFTKTFDSHGCCRNTAGLSNLSNLYNHWAKYSYCQFSSNNSRHCIVNLKRVIHARMSSPSPPGRCPPLISLWNCWPRLPCLS